MQHHFSQAMGRIRRRLQARQVIHLLLDLLSGGLYGVLGGLLVALFVTDAPFVLLGGVCLGVCVSAYLARKPVRYRPWELGLGMDRLAGTKELFASAAACDPERSVFAQVLIDEAESKVASASPGLFAISILPSGMIRVLLPSCMICILLLMESSVTHGRAVNPDPEAGGMVYTGDSGEVTTDKPEVIDETQEALLPKSAETPSEPSPMENPTTTRRDVSEAGRTGEDGGKTGDEGLAQGGAGEGDSAADSAKAQVFAIRVSYVGKTNTVTEQASRRFHDMRPGKTIAISTNIEYSDKIKRYLRRVGDLE